MGDRVAHWLARRTCGWLWLVAGDEGAQSLAAAPKLATALAPASASCVVTSAAVSLRRASAHTVSKNSWARAGMSTCRWFIPSCAAVLSMSPNRARELASAMALTSP